MITEALNDLLVGDLLPQVLTALGSNAPFRAHWLLSKVIGELGGPVASKDASTAALPDAARVAAQFRVIDALFQLVILRTGFVPDAVGPESRERQCLDALTEARGFLEAA